VGIENLSTLVVRDSGHFVPEEQRQAVARGIEAFVNSI
jgi:pimeloyl-ACP methyl ester carboxylesterase